MKNKLIFLFVVLGVLSLSLVTAIQPASAQEITPTPTSPGMTSPMDLMVPPPLGDNPDQADYGAQVYYYVCMACHGDKGQGLTPEWMEEWDLGKNSCWESRCHAANHPPEGFKLPRKIPGVIGPVLTDRFSTGLALHDYIKKYMPWHAPGTLKEDEYWQLTAFLLRSNGLWKESTTIDADNAALYIIHIKLPTPTPLTPFSPTYSNKVITYGFVVCILILMGGLFLPLWFSSRKTKSTHEDS